MKDRPCFLSLPSIFLASTSSNMKERMNFFILYLQGLPKMSALPKMFSAMSQCFEEVCGTIQQLELAKKAAMTGCAGMGSHSANKV